MTRDSTEKIDSALVRAKDPVNPEGKGQVGFLLDWSYSSPRGVVAKRKPQLMADYFTSLLVLSAAFKFKPVFGKRYFLYAENDGWALSLIGPDEWNTNARRQAFIGACVLHDDATWSIEPSLNIGKNGDIDDALLRFYNGFVEDLRSEHPLENKLPFYKANLPYYQRLFAAALSRSMITSIFKGEQQGMAALDWLQMMPRDAHPLLQGSGKQKP